MGESQFIPQICLYHVCDSATDALEHLVGQAKFASVLLELPPAVDVSLVKRSIAMAQSKGAAALLILNEVSQLPAFLATGADGVHLPWHDKLEETYAKVRQIVGPRGIVGVDAGRSRHDAMSLAEAGADYIAFGLGTDLDASASQAERNELCAWWSEIFEVPVVALDVSSPEEVPPLFAVRAEFLCLRLSAGTDGVLNSIERALHGSHLAETT